MSMRISGMALVIGDSSTLIHLTSIGRLALLQTFYEQITIPPAVWNEVVEQGAGRAGATEVAEAREAGWIHVVAPADEALIHLLKRDLDAGESEVIALAVERQADLILLDESEARRIAKGYNLDKTGVIGLLIRARREGLVESLQAEMERLQTEGGFWIEEGLVHRVLASIGEGTP
jgi:predicted nucleic acid-binding protein